jgi:hypothetical protein
MSLIGYFILLFLCFTIFEISKKRLSTFSKVSISLTFYFLSFFLIGSNGWLQICLLVCMMINFYLLEKLNKTVFHILLIITIAFFIYVEQFNGVETYTDIVHYKYEKNLIDEYYWLFPYKLYMEDGHRYVFSPLQNMNDVRLWGFKWKQLYQNKLKFINGAPYYLYIHQGKLGTLPDSQWVKFGEKPSRA